MGLGAELFLEVLFYHGKSQGEGKSNSQRGRISLPDCLSDSVSGLIRERDERVGSFIFMAIRGASWWIVLPGWGLFH